jgi:metal-responsive CopG/Arc/MetJ family transcriptional regulator
MLCLADTIFNQEKHKSRNSALLSTRIHLDRDNCLKCNVVIDGASRFIVRMMVNVITQVIISNKIGWCSCYAIKMQ